MGGEREELRSAAATAMAAAREKSSFAVTCSLLSKYLKSNKGGLHGLGMAPPAAAGVFRPPTTMNLLSALDAPADEPNEEAKASTEPRPADSAELSPVKDSTEPPVLAAPADQHIGENPREEAAEEAHQLTIIYGGKVVVFDNFPSTNVNDLLQNVNSGGGADKTSTNAAPQNLPTPSHNLSADLPIARRNSLHRFLEKRKGRITAKSPYQVITSAEASSQSAGEKSWLGLGQEAAAEQRDKDDNISRDSWKVLV